MCMECVHLGQLALIGITTSFPFLFRRFYENRFRGTRAKHRQGSLRG